MNNNMLASAIDRTITSYTMMGRRHDQRRRQLLRGTVATHIQDQVDQGQHDLDLLVLSALKHLVSLEDDRPQLRPPPKMKEAAN